MHSCKLAYVLSNLNVGAHLAHITERGVLCVCVCGAVTMRSATVKTLLKHCPKATAHLMFHIRAHQ